MPRYLGKKALWDVRDWADQLRQPIAIKHCRATGDRRRGTRMEHDFWTEAWATGRTGFHSRAAHPALRAFAHRFLRGAEETVFVPLCGKTLDMPWLAAQGHHVIGGEFVKQAIDEFFEEQGQTPQELPHGAGARYASERIGVLHGDVFEVAKWAMPRPVTAVWDRAAMVALPPARRSEYVEEVIRRVAAPGAMMLLNVFEYDEREMAGPPFAVSASEVQSLFSDCRVELLESTDGVNRVNRPDRPVSRFDILTWLVELPT